LRSKKHYCIVFEYLYSAAQSPTEVGDGQVLRRATDEQILKERMILWEASRRRFHREGPITAKDLDLAKLAIVVQAQW